MKRYKDMWKQLRLFIPCQGEEEEESAHLSIALWK